jgi:threonine dehydrogenase-like Zn-dependent dehydrogenase
MKALCFEGRNAVKIENVPDPTILSPHDAIVRVTTTAICGSDLHLVDGYVPTMKRGDVLGHEFMGEVVEVGSEVSTLSVGDRVVVPFPIACGACTQCRLGNTTCCENSNPNAGMAEKLYGHPLCGAFGYSHLTGGYAGGQAEYVRVPFADVGPLKIDDDLTDEQVLFLSDIFPTGFMAAEMCDLKGGEVVAIWGAGPVGQFAASSAFLLGAERVIVIDRFDYRLELAAKRAGVETLNYEGTDVVEELKELTGGRGPDACIEAAGMEAHHDVVPIYAYDRIKQAMRLESDRAYTLREAIFACKSAGVVSVVGVYGGFVDKFPMGAVMNRSLTIRSGQCHVHRYMRPLLDRIRGGEIDPASIITHTLPLDEAPAGYEKFKNKEDGCVKVVLKP